MTTTRSTLADLLAFENLSEQTFIDSGLELAHTLGFRVTNWISGGIGRTLVQLQALAAFSERLTVTSLARSAFVSLAELDWLTILAREVYDIERKLATFATWDLDVSVSSGAAPVSFGAGEFVVQTTSGVRFENTGSFTCAAGSTETVPIRALESGTSGNVADESITSVVTSAPGTTVTNPAASQTLTAEDQESDESLAARCQAKWATLSSLAVDGWYETHALGVDGVGRVRVTEAGGSDDPGTVNVLLAGTTGIIDEPTRAAVDALLTSDDYRGLNDTVVVTAATALSCDWSGGTVYVPASYTDAQVTAAQAVVDSVIDSVASALPIGGDSSTYDDDGGVTGAFPAALIERALYRRTDFDFVDVDLAPVQFDMLATQVAVVTGYPTVTRAVGG